MNCMADVRPGTRQLEFLDKRKFPELSLEQHLSKAAWLLTVHRLEVSSQAWNWLQA